MAKPDELPYDDLEWDAHLDDEFPMECDDCQEVYSREVVHMCPTCDLTVCEYCWEGHKEKHERG